jgi:hypothetical protein
MSALDQISTARNDEFAARVLFIATKVAQMVAAEDAGTADHDIRVKYSGFVIRGDDNPKMIATHVISSNPTIGAAIDADPEAMGAQIPDGDIEFALSSIWTARALAYQDR